MDINSDMFSSKKRVCLYCYDLGLKVETCALVDVELLTSLPIFVRPTVGYQM